MEEKIKFINDFKEAMGCRVRVIIFLSKVLKGNVVGAGKFFNNGIDGFI